MTRSIYYYVYEWNVINVLLFFITFFLFIKFPINFGGAQRGKGKDRETRDGAFLYSERSGSFARAGNDVAFKEFGAPLLSFYVVRFFAHTFYVVLLLLPV